MDKTKRTVKKCHAQKSLYERYYELNRKGQKAFRTFCIEDIEITTKTIYNWISGRNDPDTLKKKAIAKFFKTTDSEIWSDN